MCLFRVCVEVPAPVHVPPALAGHQWYFSLIVFVSSDGCGFVCCDDWC